MADWRPTEYWVDWNSDGKLTQIWVSATTDIPPSEKAQDDDQAQPAASTPRESDPSDG
jgi:hypothetical protein